MFRFVIIFLAGLFILPAFAVDTLKCYKIAQADAPVMDGNLSDWPAAYKARTFRNAGLELLSIWPDGNNGGNWAGWDGGMTSPNAGFKTDYNADLYLCQTDSFFYIGWQCTVDDIVTDKDYLRLYWGSKSFYFYNRAVVDTGPISINTNPVWDDIFPASLSSTVKAGIHVGTGSDNLPVYEFRMPKSGVFINTARFSYMAQDWDGDQNWTLLSMAARYTDDKGPHYTTWANNYSYFPVTRFVDTDPQGNPIGIEKAPDTKVLPRLLASPDPFNASTILHYSLPGAGVVSVDIFNVEGKLVASLLKSRQPAGSGALKFDARQLPGGVYIAQMRLGNRKLTRRITLLK